MIWTTVERYATFSLIATLNGVPWNAGASFLSFTLTVKLVAANPPRLSLASTVIIIWGTCSKSKACERLTSPVVGWMDK